MSVGPPERLSEGGAQSPEECETAALLSALPSAEPGDVAVARVWRNVSAPPARPATWLRPWLAIGVVAAAIVAVFAIPLVFRGPPTVPAEVMLSRGGVFSTRPAEAWVPAGAGQPLHESQRVRTDASGQALLHIAGVATVLVSPGSDVGMERLSNGTALRLTRGALTARVLKRKPGDPFRVETDRYTVRVVGTLFTVAQAADGVITVSVREGTVEVLEQTTVMARVTAGMRWTSDRAEPAGTDTTSDRVVAVLEGGLSRSPAPQLAAHFEEIVPAVDLPAPPREIAPVAPAVPPPAQPAPAPRHERTDRSPVSEGAGPIARPPQVEEHPAEPAATPAQLQVALPPAAPASAPSVAPPAVAPVVASSRPASVATPPKPVEPAAVPAHPPAPVLPTCEMADALVKRGDIRAAADVYDRVADSDEPDAETALYESGRLARKDLHDSGRAQKAFMRYEERYPNGTFAPEVALGLIEIAGDRQVWPDVVDRATRFLQWHAADARSAQVRFLRGQALYQQGEYARALEDFRALVHSDRADDALYFQATCQAKLGRKDEAAATLREYIHRFPNGAHRVQADQALDEE